MAAHPAIEKFIRDYAASIGIDPETAVRVSKAEALNVFDPTQPDRGGDRGSSFGPFQLHYGGIAKGMSNPGLGDAFTKATGLDARDPSTWPHQVKFALDTAKQDGWRQWMGAANTGIPRWAGIGGKGTGAKVETPSTAISHEAFYDPRSDTPSSGRPVGSEIPGPPANQYALPLGDRPSESGGARFGGTGLGTPTPAAVATEKTKQPWWKNALKGLADAGATNFGAGGAAPAALPPTPGAAVTQLQPVAPIDPRQQEAQRQQLAMALARLNQGTLWG